jgi:hypothetical protein
VNLGQFTLGIWDGLLWNLRQWMGSECINYVQPLLLYIISALRPLVTQSKLSQNQQSKLSQIHAK